MNFLFKISFDIPGCQMLKIFMRLNCLTNRSNLPSLIARQRVAGNLIIYSVEVFGWKTQEEIKLPFHEQGEFPFTIPIFVLTWITLFFQRVVFQYSPLHSYFPWPDVYHLRQWRRKEYKFLYGFLFYHPIFQSYPGNPSPTRPAY